MPPEPVNREQPSVPMQKLGFADSPTDRPARELWLVRSADLDAWRAALTPSARAWVLDHGFRAEAGKLLLLPAADGSVGAAVLGLGGASAEAGFDPWLAAGLPERLPNGRWKPADLGEGDAASLALGWALGRYRFLRYKSPSQELGGQAELIPPTGADLEEVRRIAEADALARDLINTPAADMGPEQLAQAARALADRRGAECAQVIGDGLLAAGLPMIHAVGRAGPQPPRLIDLRWGDTAHPRITLVGKGVCFDTGGLDMKPSSAMALMKKDMGGAACALGLASLVMDAGLPIRLRVLIPAVENSIAGNAYRPGDILASRKGLTVEVNNTDAEGRLVLADALTLADEEGPDLLIDLATLTGAARVALGPELPALFSDHDHLAELAVNHGRESHDPLWRMPLWQPYGEDLASKVADLTNVTSNGFAGAIIGGLFLRRFVATTTPWMHVDLYAWNPKERPGRPVGGAAQAIRALYHMLRSLDPATLRR